MWLKSLPIAVVFACAFGALAPIGHLAAAPSGLSEFRGLPRQQVQRAFVKGRCRLIPFDSVYFEDGGRRRGIILTIGGPRPSTSLDVVLEHYPAKNGNWTIEVTGCRGNFITLPIRTPYAMEIPLRRMPGARRVKIVGSNGVIYRRLPGR